MDELLSLQRNLAASPNSTSLTLKLLKVARDHNLRAAAPLVAKHGVRLLRKSPSSLGDTVWTAYEQVLVACLDVGAAEDANFCLTKLEAQFPNSRRVKRLMGMFLEAEGQYSDALSLYDALLEEHPADEHARKRKVCVLKGQGNLVEAANALSAYLTEFQADTFAWKELTDLYLKLNEHKKAKFCIEEVMMAEPQNHAWACLYAEVCYTIGGEDELKIARKYYSLALQLKPEGNARALYGLVAVTSAIGAGGKKNAGDKENSALFKLASTKLLSTYLDSNPTQAEHVQAVLADLAPSH